MSDENKYDPNGALDERIQEAGELILDSGIASISMLCRKMSINYNRGAMIMEQLERLQVVGAFKGAKCRDILIDLKDELIDKIGMYE